MARQFQLRRGTTIENETFVGAVGELTYDVQRKEVRVHDNVTPGGKVLAGGGGDGESIKNQNTAQGATNPLYNWEGTLEEYLDQDIEHTHPDWICLINDDNEGGGGNGESISNQNKQSDIKQVYDWIGTLAEYEEQRVAELHPTWVCFILDDTTPKDKNLYTNRNVGDIFYTLRKDEELNGAVECNGATYNISDYTGTNSIGELLINNKLPYVSLSEYETLLSTNGVVGIFGWDGDNSISFRVPTLENIFVEAGNTNNIGEFTAAGLPNITGEFEASDDNSSTVTKGAFQIKSDAGSTTGGEGLEKILTFDASRSSSIYGNSTTVQPKSIKYRPMVQLSTGFNDEAIETCQSVKTDIENLKGYDYVVDWQVPTSENNYTWYRKYKSGWVEQGGRANQPASTDDTGTSINISLPVEMADSNYAVLTTGSVIIENTAGGGWGGMRKDSNSTTTTLIIKSNRTVSSIIFNWQVSGMAAE